MCASSFGPILKKSTDRPAPRLSAVPLLRAASDVLLSARLIACFSGRIVR